MINHLLSKIWFRGSFFTDEWQRRSYILNIVLIGSLILISWADLHILIHSQNSREKYQGIQFESFSLILLFFILIYVFFKRGHLRLASILLIGSYYLGAAYGSYHWGVSIPAILLSYALIITLTSILLGNEAGFTATFIIFMTLLVCGYKESTSSIIPIWKYQTVGMTDVIFYSLLLIVIMCISWLWNKETQKSLFRAINSEKELEKERDLLEIKVIERTNELRKAQAEKVSQLYHFAEFGKLSGGLFHDLMNPLSGVAANIEALESSLHTDLPEIKSNLERSLKASRKMDRFMNATRRQLQMKEFIETFSINSIIEDAILLLNHKAMKSLVSLEFLTNENIHTHNNPIKFQQIAINLISNAIDSYERIAYDPITRKVTIKLYSTENNIYFTVSDNGIGIPNESENKIFEPFYTTKDHYKGMGLGLSNTKENIEKYFKGDILIDKNKEKGVSFIVSFPITSQPSKE